jgi:hypothetical protein
LKPERETGTQNNNLAHRNVKVGTSDDGVAGSSFVPLVTRVC